MKVYTERDADLAYLKGKKVAVIGYGSQGHAHALNLRDSGIDVRVGLRPDSASWKKAEGAGLKVLPTAEAAAWGDVVMILVPDELAGDMYPGEIAARPHGRQVSGVRPRLQHPLQAHRAARRTSTSS